VRVSRLDGRWADGADARCGVLGMDCKVWTCAACGAVCGVAVLMQGVV